jgi:hypothetical protein
MSVNGALLLQTGSTAGNYACAQYKTLSWILDRAIVANTHEDQSAKNLWFEAAFSGDVSATDVDLFVGLSETAASVVGPSPISQNYIGFNVSNGATAVKYISSTGGTSVSGSVSDGSGNAVSLVQGTLTTVGLKFNANNVDFYVNKNYMHSIQVNSLPTSPLALTFQVVTNSATNRTLVLDYVYVAKNR